MIDTSEIRYFACMWFVPRTKHGDYMALLYQKHDESWEIKYRFRYYTSASPDGVDDEKHWYVLNFKDSKAGGRDADEIERKFDVVLATMFTSRYSRETDKIEIRGNSMKFVEVMSKQEWVHFHTEPSSSVDAPS